MTEQQTELRHDVLVTVAPQAAFDAFMQLDRIKPREHNLLPVPIAETIVEPHAGGGIIDRGTDGSQCQWGTVLLYDPPHRFTFSWNIGPDWQTTDDPPPSQRGRRDLRTRGRGHTRDPGAPTPRTSRSGLGVRPRRRGRRRWMAAVPGAVRRDHPGVSRGARPLG